MSDVFPLEAHTPAQSEPMEYVEHPVAFVPTENAIISNPTTGTSVPENAPLDVTMLAMLGLTMAGAGLMKSESARKKQDELAKQNAIAQANLVAVLAEQKDSAEENWAENQAMRAEAKQQVYTKVQQSQANIDFWASYTAWKIKVAEAEEKRRQTELEARIKAYYEALRLKPASSQPAQPAPVLGLLTGLLTGAKILGQGIRAVNQVVRAIVAQNITTERDCSCYDNVELTVPVVMGNVTYVTQQQACEFGYSYTYPECTDSVPSDPNIVFFGGSYGGQPDENGNPTTPHSQGPDPVIQTPAWVAVENTIVIPHRFPGSTYDDSGNIDVTAKQNHANLVINNGNYDNDFFAIGYSGGADSALIFANMFLQTNTHEGDLLGLALLEGTMTGGMDGGMRLENEAKNILDTLLMAGVNVYILNDRANDTLEWSQLSSYSPPLNALGIYCYDPRPNQEHWDGALGGQFGTGTNNSIEYRDFVLDWLNNPTPCD